MINILIKRQMMENFSFFWHDKGKNKMRTGSALIGSVIQYILIFGFLAAIFTMLGIYLCPPLHAAGMDWLYFGIISLIGIVLGAFGSVFNTYATVYLPKDNEMLLAMPIRPSVLLVARLSGVYAMGLLYEVLAVLPALIVYYVMAKPGIATIVLSFFVMILLSVFILILSSVLGWAVALVASRLKRKSFVTVIVSLIFIAAYYYGYGKAAGMVESIVADPQVAGGKVKGAAYPFYMLGMASAGDPLSFLILLACILLLFLLVYKILAGTYHHILMTNKGVTKKVEKEQVEKKLKTAKVGNTASALFSKERRRFTGSPNYMLNCGLGIVFMLILAVTGLIKGGSLKPLFVQMRDLACLISCAGVCLTAGMNTLTAPSVSLEGKNLWILQSYPVSPWKPLLAKLKLHLVVTWIPAMILTGCLLYLIRPGIEWSVLMVFAVTAYVVFMAEIGLVLNLKAPSLNWVNETVPIKQSLSVMVSLFGGWALIALAAVGYYLLSAVVTPLIWMAVMACVFATAALFACFWLKTRGAEIFQNL